jgi:hypothetical protein
MDFPVSQMANDLLAEVIPETVVRPKIDIDIFKSDKRSVTFRPRLLDRGFPPRFVPNTYIEFYVKS